MAAAEAEATNRPGVVLVTLAPGITNAINGIAHAAMDGVPLLVVSGQHHPERAPLIIRQSLNSHQLVQSLCKATLTASPRICQIMARALDLALAPPSGPVLLELRDDIAAMEALDKPDTWQSHTRYVRGVISPEPLPGDLSALIRRSRNPCVVVGGACPTDACGPVAHLSERLRAPVFTSPSALGTVPPEHEWFAGTFMNGNFEAELLARSDLIFTIGLDARDFFNAPWRYSAPIIAVNEHADTQRFTPVSLQVIGNTAAILDLLRCSNSTWSSRDVEAYRRSVDVPFHLQDEAFTIPASLRLARRLLPPETLVAVDAGFGKPLTSYLWNAPRPKQYFTAHALSTMGFALPAANALKLAQPQRPVVAFMGDGSLLMRAAELTVGAEQGIAPISVAWMDRSLAQIETKQLRQGLEPIGARLPAFSCVRVADAFGAHGCDVASLQEFEAALVGGLASDRPTLIGAHVDQSRRAEWFELMRG